MFISLSIPYTIAAVEKYIKYIQWHEIRQENIEFSPQIQYCSCKLHEIIHVQKRVVKLQRTALHCTEHYSKFTKKFTELIK